MIASSKRFRLFVSLSVIAGVAACNDRPEPDNPTSPTLESPAFNQVTPALAPLSVGPGRTLDDQFVDLAHRIPGFGGSYYDASGVLTTYLTDLRLSTSADRMLGTAFHVSATSSRLAIRYKQAAYDFLQLKAWNDRLMSLMSVPGVSMLDIDEVANRIRVGVDDDATRARLKREIAALGVPVNAVIVSRVSRLKPMADLNFRIRPTFGGLKIERGSRGCTLGFTALLSGVRGFVTASHCSSAMGSVDGTVYSQGGFTAAGRNRIGRETVDPAFSTGGICPAGRNCRYSDADFSAQDANQSSTFRVARTTVEGTTGLFGSLTIAEQLPVVGEIAAPLTGTLVRKTGAQSGTSRGNVSTTCATFNPGPGVVAASFNVTLLCQYVAQAVAHDGDSGAPVFLWSGTPGTGATLVGTMWGGDDFGLTFAFSPMSGIEHDLGALTTQ